MEETIVAIASAPGSGLRGIVRVSGPLSLEVFDKCIRGRDGVSLETLEGASIVPAAVRISPTNRDVPGRLYVWPNHRSYTGQPTAEFHTYGARPLLESIVRELRRFGARLAEPGEFTMRAFLAGRIDLTQAEAVLGVIDAESSPQADVALKQLAGGLAQPLHKLRDRMLNLLADIEAGLDFVEEDIEFVETSVIERELGEYLDDTNRLLASMRDRELPQGEFRVVFRGLPNVGKSSLMNAIVQESAAIVSDSAGTTRDYVERRCDIHGLHCLLTDTAGFDESSSDEIDRASQEQTNRQLATAHLELFCVDTSRAPTTWERERLSEVDDKRVVVLTKADQPTVDRSISASLDGILTSAATGQGIERLMETIAGRVWSARGEAAGVVATTATRCVGSLESAREAITRATEIFRHGAGDELLALELRQALHDLGIVAGVVYTDDVLDRVFSRFCIGK